MSTYLGKYSDSGKGNPLTDARLMKDSGPLDGGGYDAGDRWCGGENRKSPRPSVQDNGRETT
jgi:hypothetical protein